MASLLTAPLATLLMMPLRRQFAVSHYLFLLIAGILKCHGLTYGLRFESAYHDYLFRWSPPISH